MYYLETIKIKKLHEDAVLPTHGSGDAAGYDLCSIEDLVIKPGETQVVHTGWVFEIPDGYFGGIYARSGISTKHGIRPSNCTGIIDSDYRGEVLVGLHNDSDKMYKISKGERVAQIIIQPFLLYDGFTVCDKLSNTDRGDGGFGSTGK